MFKRFLLINFLFVLLCNFSFSSNYIINKYPNFSNIDEKDIHDLVYEIVPEEYVKPFLYNTEDDDLYNQNSLRLILLAIGQHESGWNSIRSYRRNYNGTYDLGYLMLNENNLKDDYFMYRFGPKCSIEDDIELYLVTCINYFKAMYNIYGINAIYTYNCGETKYVQNKIPKSTISYNEKVMYYLDFFYSKLVDIYNERIEKEKRILLEKKAKIFCEEEMKKLDSYKNLLKNGKFLRIKNKKGREYLIPNHKRKILEIIKNSSFEYYLIEDISEYGNFISLK